MPSYGEIEENNKQAENLDFTRKINSFKENFGYDKSIIHLPRQYTLRNAFIAPKCVSSAIDIEEFTTNLLLTKIEIIMSLSIVTENAGI